MNGGKSAFNLGEITLVKSMVNHIKSFCEMSKLLILTPYQAQLQQLQREIPQVKCSTIHAIQVGWFDNIS